MIFDAKKEKIYKNNLKYIARRYSNYYDWVDYLYGQLGSHFASDTENPLVDVSGLFDDICAFTGDYCD
jgi:hypothetical protein